MPGGPWRRGHGHGRGHAGGNFKSDFGPSGSNYGRPFGHGHFGPGHFGPGGPGGHFGPGMGPNFATGDVFGFL